MANVDERIVNMTFNNKDFEKGIATTTNSLAGLDKALNLDGAKNALKNFDTSAVTNGVGRISDAVDKVGIRFNAMYVIAASALGHLTIQAVNTAENFLKSFSTDQVAAGWQQFEAQITSVQTLMNSTGLDESSIDTYFNTLNDYANKTVYSIGDMTGALAKMTNAGIDINTATPAIQGIANLVALAGQGTQALGVALYNLPQSLGSGFLQTIDYKSLVNANIATSSWKDQLVSLSVAMGTLRDNGDGTFTTLTGASEKAYTKQALFNDALSEGWATSQVLLASFNQLADGNDALGSKALAAAQDVKSFSMMMDTLSSNVATGWSQTFRLLIGNLDESKKLFTPLTNAIGDVLQKSSDARNAILAIWHGGGADDPSSGYAMVIQGFKNIWTAFWKIVTPIQDAWHEVFPPQLGETLIKLSKIFQDLTAKLIISDGAASNLHAIFKVLFTVLKFGVDIVTGVVKVAAHLLGIIFDLIKGVGGFITPILTFVRSLIPVSKAADGAGWSISSLFDLLVKFEQFIDGKLVGAMEAGAKAFGTWLNSGGPKKALIDMMNALIQFGQAVVWVTKILFEGDYTHSPFFTEDSKFVDILFKIREGAITAAKAIVDFFKNVGKNFSNMTKIIQDNLKNGFSNVNWDAVLAALNLGLLGAITVAIIRMVSSLTNVFKGTGGILQSFSNVIGQLGDTLKAFQSKLKAEALKEIAIAILILAGGLLVLSLIDPERLIPAAAAMVTVVGMLVGTMAAIDKMSGLGVKDTAKLILMALALQVLAQAILIMSAAVAILGRMSWEELAKGLGSVAILLTGVLIAVKVFSNKQVTKDISVAALALLEIAYAMQMLIIPIVALGLLPFHVLVQGMAAVAVALAGMLVAVKILSNKKTTKDIAIASLSLLSFAAALNMLIIPIVTLGLLPFNVLLQGMIAVGIALAALVGVVLLLGTGEMKTAAPIAALSILVLAAALNMLIIPIVTLGLLPFDKLVQGMVAVGIALVVLSALMIGIGFAGPAALIGAAAMVALGIAMVGFGIAMVAFAVSIVILTGAIAALGAMPVEVVVAGITALAAIFGVLGAAALIVGPLSPLLLLIAASVITLAIAFALVAVSIAILGPALIPLTAGLLAFAAASGPILNSAPAMLAIGGALIVLGAGALVAGAGLIVLGAGFVVLSAGLALLALFALAGSSSLKLFVDAIVGLLGQAVPLLLMAGTLAVLGAAILVLGVGLVVMGTGLLLVAGAMALMSIVGAAGAVALALVVNNLLGFIGSLPGILLMAAGLTVLGAAILVVGAGLLLLGVGALVAAGGLAVMGVAAPLAAAAFQTLMRGITMIAPQIGNIALFGAAMIALGAGALVAAVGLLLLAPTLMLLALGLTMLVTALRAFTTVGQKGTDAFMVFYKSLDGMIWQVPALLSIGAAWVVMGGGLLLLGAGLALVAVAAVAAAVALTMLANITNLIDLSFKKMQAAITAFLPVGVTMAAIAVFVLALAAAMAVLAAATILAGMGLGSVKDNLQGISQYAQLVVMLMNMMMKGVGASLPQFKSDLNTAASDLNAFVTQVAQIMIKLDDTLVQSKDKLSTSTKLLATMIVVGFVVTLAASSGQLYNAGYNVGDNIIQGMKDGLQNGSSSLNRVATQVAENALAASKDALGVHSPSTEYEDVGMFSILGWVRGLLKNSDKAEDAAASVGQNSILALRNSLSGISDLVAQNLDLNPTITPVLDLTSVNRDAALIGSALGSTGISVASSYSQATDVSSENNGEGPGGSDGPVQIGDTYNYTQNNNSPKALSNAEIYRNTKNQISTKKGEIAKK